MIAARSIPSGAPVPVLVVPDDEDVTVLFSLPLLDSDRHFLYYTVTVYVDYEYKINLFIERQDLDLNIRSVVAT